MCFVLVRNSAATYTLFGYFWFNLPDFQHFRVDFGQIRADFEHFLTAFISRLWVKDQVPSRLRIIRRSGLDTGVAGHRVR